MNYYKFLSYSVGLVPFFIGCLSKIEVALLKMLLIFSTPLRFEQLQADGETGNYP